MNEAWTLAMNLFVIGDIGFARSSQARSRSAGQGAGSPVIGSGTSVEDPMLKLVCLKAPSLVLCWRAIFTTLLLTIRKAYSCCRYKVLLRTLLL